MTKLPPEQFRILAIDPSTRGFGFAVLEGEGTLINWGVKMVSGDKNTQSIAKIKELIDRYEPGTLILEPPDQGNRRSPRIIALIQQIADEASSWPIKTAFVSQKQIDEVFFPEGVGTKYARAKLIAERFPEELGLRLPPKRLLYESEAHATDIFDAVALVLAFRLWKTT